MNVIYGLNELNRDIKMLGGDGLDLSGIKMPENSSPKVISQTQFDQGSAIVAGAAELSALIINQSEKAKVRNFRDEAEKYKSTFDGFVESEEKVVAQYNSLLQTAKTTDISQIGNPGQINSTNQNQQGAQVSPNTDLEHYWDEGKPAANNGRNKQTSNGQANYSNSNQSTQSQAPQSSQNTQPQVSQSGADFWDDAGTATASTPAKGNQKNTGKSLKPISTSSDLQSNFDKADQSLSQSTANSLNKINSVEKGNSGWANASFDKYKADIEAVTASKSNGNNGKGGAQNGNGCTQANNDPSLKARVQNCQSQACILQCEADLIKLNLQDCPDQFSPEDTQKMQTMINTLENEIRSMR